jgi:2-methylcitrate dehydratase
MVVTENPRYSADYLDPDKRSIASAIRVVFRDGSQTPPAEVEFPIGHRRRRDEAVPLLHAKLEANLLSRFEAAHVGRILELGLNEQRLLGTPVPAFMELLAAV